MPSFWRIVNQVLQEADLILEVVDARYVEETRNREIEQKIESSGKRILYVINKCDLVKDKEQLEKIKSRLQPSLFISSTEKLGTTLLKKKILELGRGQPITVGVVGYPNVGKSSVINALAGRKAARTSSTSGFTRALQKIRVNEKIVLLDTPGVFPYQEKDAQKEGFTGTVDFGRIKDPEAIALQLITQQKALIRAFYQIEGEDPEEILEKVAVKFKKLEKGGQPNLETAARLLLKDWQKGKMAKFVSD